MNKWKVVKGLLVVVTLILLGTYLGTNYQLHPIEGGSMSPLYDTGDWVLLKKTKTIKRQQVVSFWYETDKELYMKRIIGLPQDALLIHDNQLIISLDHENPFEVTYRVQLSNEIAQAMATLDTIPNDYYFVLGDNLSISNDSRMIGLVHKKDIIGEIVYRF